MIVVTVIALAISVGLLSESSAEISAQSEADQHFTLQVWPLLEAKCTACHGADPEEIKGGLDFVLAMGLKPSSLDETFRFFVSVFHWN